MARYGATTLQLNTRYHIAGVYDAQAQTLNVYLNGQLDNGTLVGTVTPTQLDSLFNVFIGSRPSANVFGFIGTIDDVRVYNRALAQAEIQADMNAAASAPPADVIAPSTPGAPSGTAAGANEVDLSWTASTDNVGVTGYVIERCQGAGCTNFVQIAVTSGTSFSDTTVAAGTSYSYRVRAIDGSGNVSGFFNVVSVTTGGGQQGQLQGYYIVPDHLNTPRAIEDQSGKTVWRWDQGEPFGVTQPNPDPDGDGIAFDFPLRFPGQYFDKETNLHYNYFRDYDPRTGRYMRSDPIGIRGDLNTYLYIKGSPLSLADPTGLKQLPDNPWEILGRIAKPCEVVTSARKALNAIELASYEKYQRDLTDLANFRQLGEEGCIRVDNANPNPCEFGKCLESVNKSYLEGKKARDKSYQEYRTQLYEDPRFLERLISALASLCSPSTVYGPAK